MQIKFNDAQFKKDMNNIIQYSIGFLEGAQRGKPTMLRNIGAKVITAFKEFVDSNARVNPQALHHIYEWYQVGSPDGRLFDLKYTVTGSSGISFKSTFSQSKSIQNGSNVPFYNKAEIMEKGIPVKISPTKSPVLVFEQGAETVFVKNEVTIDNPGGNEVVGSYENIFNQFFNQYFTQAFLQSSGILEHLKNPIEFKTYFYSAKTNGRSKGIQAGIKWIERTGVI